MPLLVGKGQMTRKESRDARRHLLLSLIYESQMVLMAVKRYQEARAELRSELLSAGVTSVEIERDWGDL